jgi:leucyl/phenylalanyl-tRNA--protein transferase
MAKKITIMKALLPMGEAEQNNQDHSGDDITASMMLNAYVHGIFPMAKTHDSDILYWVEPDMRCLMPLDDHFHIPKRLQRTIRQGYQKGHFSYAINQDFEYILTQCARIIPGHKTREECWINPTLFNLYMELYEMGYAHALGVYDDKNICQGGIFGIAIGNVFCGESMFSYQRDYSKIALVTLVEHLRHNHFKLFDVQFYTEHLGQFGAYEIPQEDYMILLQNSL